MPKLKQQMKAMQRGAKRRLKTAVPKMRRRKQKGVSLPAGQIAQMKRVEKRTRRKALKKAAMATTPQAQQKAYKEMASFARPAGTRKGMPLPKAPKSMPAKRRVRRRRLTPVGRVAKRALGLRPSQQLFKAAKWLKR
jgi:hypothetical protein